MTTVEVLRKAKAELTPATWGQGGTGGKLLPPEGKCCLMMAVGRHSKAGALDEESEFHRARLALVAATGEKDVVKWQDTPGRTLEEVHAAFDRAISLASETAAGKEP